MSLLDTEEVYQANQQFAESYKLVTLRHILTISGPNPTINPFTGSVTVGAGGVTAGSTVATFTAPATGSYFLEVGDALLVGNSTVASLVQARVSAAAGVFASVQLSPGVATASSSGAAVGITFTNDYNVESTVSAYPAELVDGTVVTLKDLRVFANVSDTLARTLPAPLPTDKLIFDGVVRTVGVITPHYVGANIVQWEMQGKS